MGTTDEAVGEVGDIVHVAAVCAEVVGCYDRLLVGDRTVPRELDRALSSARDLGGLSGRLGWALDLVGRGATGASPGELAEAIETLRRAATCARQFP
jgi:hypothetical protein